MKEPKPRAESSRDHVGHCSGSFLPWRQQGWRCSAASWSYKGWQGPSTFWNQLASPPWLGKWRRQCHFKKERELRRNFSTSGRRAKADGEICLREDKHKDYNSKPWDQSNNCWSRRVSLKSRNILRLKLIKAMFCWCFHKEYRHSNHQERKEVAG